MTDSKNRKRYYLIYSAVFCACAALMVFLLYIKGKSNINYTSDGMNQHYRALLYYSNYLKNIVSTFIHTGKLEVMLWDHTIGEGSDIINTLHGYGVGDPIAFLSILVPEKFMPVFYVFNALIRLYIGGLFFSMLCFYKKMENPYGVLAGALAYAFCFWGLQSFTLHIYFLTPLMFMPMYILGLEMIIEENRPHLFILTVMFSAMSWLYFFYMEALATAIYGILRVFIRNGKRVLASILELLKILGYAVLGVLMAAIILLPMAYAYMGDSRLAITRSIPLLYPAFFYERLFTVYVANDFPYDLYMGFVSASLLSIALLFKDFRKNILLVLIYVLGFACVCLPIGGKIFNGFAYVSQRWSFAIALPVAYTLSLYWNRNEENKKYLLFVLGSIILLSLYSAWSRTERALVPVGLCIIFYLLSIFKLDRKIGKLDLKQSLMIFLLLINIFYIYQYNLSERGGRVYRDLLSINGAKNLVERNEAAVMTEYFENDDDFFRYDSNYFTNNDSISSGIYSTNYYWSITNASDQKFRILTGLRDKLNWQLRGYDCRAALDTLASVKYYISKDNYDTQLPYGFEKFDVKGDYTIYRNTYFLPFAYTYEKAISYDAWYAMDPVERQESMLEAVTIETEREDAVSLSQIEKIPFELIASEGVEVSKGVIRTSEKDQSVTIRFEHGADIETYLTFIGLEYSDDYGIIEDDHTIALIEVTADPDVDAYINHMTLEHRYNFNKHDYVVNLGHDPSTKEVTVSFDLPGTYTFDAFYLSAVSMAEYGNKIEALGEEHLEDLVLGCNEVTGTITLGKDKYLLFSIPYSKGWKAYVDGKECKVLKANEHYIAVKVEKGSHTVDLKYMTPGLKAGTAVSIVSLVAYLGLIIWRKKTGRNNA